MAWTGFAATASGDRRADVHYAVDWDRAAASYRDALRELESRKAELSSEQFAKESKELAREHAVPTRTVWVQDSSTHTATWALFSADPITRRPVRVKYIAMPYETGLPPTPDHTDSWRVWELAPQLRAALETEPGITVSTETRDGVAGYRVGVPASGDDPAWSAFVDRATGLTLSVTRVSGAGGGRVSAPYHVRDLRVNEPPGPYAFVVRPDYREVPGLRGGPEVKTLDLVEDATEDRWLPAAALSQVALPSQLVPSWVPEGFALSEIHAYRAHPAATSVGLIYRRGLGTLYSWSGRRYAEVTVSEEGELSRPQTIPVFDRGAWPLLGGYLAKVSTIDRVQGGAFDGAPAALTVRIGEPARLEAWTSRDQTHLAGDTTASEILAVAGSLEPLDPGAWQRPLSGLAGLIALAVAAAAAAVAAVMWARARRASAQAARPQLALLTWPLAGLAAVAAGACLDWHALRNGLDFGVRGVGEPLGLWVVSAALAAATCAALVQLASGPRRRRLAKATALLLSAAAFAGAAFAFVYLPSVARFVTGTWDGTDPTVEGWLLRITASSVSPSAAVGLYVSLAGALLLFVGVLLVHGQAVGTAVPEAARLADRASCANGDEAAAG